MQNKNIVRIVCGVAFLLLIPLVAMQFTSEVQWTLFDFIFAGTLLLGTGLAYEFIAKQSSDAMYRSAVGLGVITALALVWINGAVGIIGSENNPANLLYGGVLLVGFIGAALARLKAPGMKITLFAMAVVQALVPIVALILWKSDFGPEVAQIFVLNAIFVVSWIVSGILFRHAGATIAK